MVDALPMLFKRIQDGVGELGESVLGNRSERALDQGIRGIDLVLHQARSDLASAKARRIAKEDAINAGKTRIHAAELQIRSLLAKRRVKQARTLAAEVVALEAEQLALGHEARALVDQEGEFVHAIAQLEHQLRRMKHQLGTLRATTGIQRAQAAVAHLQPGPETHPESAQASAQRLRERAATTKPAASKPATSKPSVRQPRGKRRPAEVPQTDQAIENVLERLSMHAKSTSKTAVNKTTARKTK